MNAVLLSYFSMEAKKIVPFLVSLGAKIKLSHESAYPAMPLTAPDATRIHYQETHDTSRKLKAF